MYSEINKRIDSIKRLCKKYKVISLYAFGSILTPRFNDKSDIDLLVEFDKKSIKLENYFDNFFDFMYAMQDLFGKKIDLVCMDALTNKYFIEELEETKLQLYASPAPSHALI